MWAVGIHLIVATQRPSVDVVAGPIEASFPTRIAFQLASKVDARTVLDANGAEALLGRGDMRFVPPGAAKQVRVHGAWVADEEVKAVCEFLWRKAARFIDMMEQDRIIGPGQGSKAREILVGPEFLAKMGK